MAEWPWIVLPALGAVLWGIGGTYWKPARRFLYPAIGALTLILAGLQWYWALAYGLACAGTFSLGYGDAKSWLERILVGASYGACTLLIGPLWVAPLITLIVFTGQMVISQKFGQFTWKWVEISTGFTLGALACWALHLGGW